VTISNCSGRLRDTSMTNISASSPVEKFVESFALVVDQFRTPKERRLSYEFHWRRLVFISKCRTVSSRVSAVSRVIRPVIRRQVAAELRIPIFRVSN